MAASAVHIVDVTALMTRYAVDQAHARRVADHALALFDALVPQVNWPSQARALLETAALLHNVGLAVNAERHHLIGRDIVALEAGLPADAAAAVSLIVALHRKRPRPRLEPSYWALRPRDREWVLQLAALVRVADGLDFSQSQSTDVLLEPAAAQLLLRCSGPHAAGDQARALAKADLWAEVLPVKLAAMEPLEPTEASPPEPETSVDDTEQLPVPDAVAAYRQTSATPASDWVRRHMLQALARLLSARRDILRDRDEDAVHSLRVACRRARSLLALADGLVDARRLRRLVRGLRELAQAAAAVRDREVAIADLSLAGRAELEPLLLVLNEELAAARRTLLQRLRDRRFEQLARRFARLAFDATAWPARPLLRNRLGSALYHGFEQIRDYDEQGLPTDVNAQHALRLAIKHMRYQLEWWETLPAMDVTQVLRPLVQLQNLLGRSNDLVVFAELLAPHPALHTPELESYLLERQRRAAEDVGLAAQQWQRLQGPLYRRRLSGIIGRLS